MQELVMSHEEIVSATERIAKGIEETLKDEKKPPLLVGVLKGAANFMLELISHIERDVLTDYIQISSYEGDHSSGEVHFLKGLSNPELHPETIILVEDIVDTGLSMHYLVEYFRKNYHPKRILVVALLDKKPARKIDVQVDFVGKELTETKFLLGYGLDYKEFKRNVPYVYVPTPEEIAEIDKLAAEVA